MKRTVSAFLIFMLLFFLVIFSSARECEEQMPPSVGAFLQNNFKGWRQIGPEGGSIIGLASDPGNPKKIFAATQFGLIYQSLDSGCNWKRISFLNEILFDFKIAPSTPLSFFALAENRICISQDGGSNWEIFSFGSNFRALQGKIVAHPHNPSILYITGQVNERLSVLKSIDGGRKIKRFGVKKITGSLTFLSVP